MKIDENACLLLWFIRYLEELRAGAKALRWRDTDNGKTMRWSPAQAKRWGFGALHAIADDYLLDEEDRLRLLLGLPAWNMRNAPDVKASEAVAYAITEATTDASSFERSVLLDEDGELPDETTMFERVSAYLCDSAVLTDPAPENVDEIREELIGLAVLPALAAFTGVWRRCDGDPGKSVQAAIVLGLEGLATTHESDC